MFDSRDIDYLTTLGLPQLRRELAVAERDASVNDYFEGTPYADAKPFPNHDYAEACKLALDIARSQQPKPTATPGRGQLDVDKARSADIVELAERYTRLRKSGTRFIGRCPIHEDNTPSFVLFPNNSFHCFGCNKGGDTIALLMAIEKIDFRTAVKRLGG